MTFVKSLNLGNLQAINVRAFCNSKNANLWGGYTNEIVG
jgi:hypothetical protein